MFDFKNDPQSAGFKYSRLTENDLRTISDAEEKISKNHNSNQVLIAYDRPEDSG